MNTVLGDPVAFALAVGIFRLSERVIARWIAGLRARVRLTVEIGMRSGGEKPGDRVG